VASGNPLNAPPPPWEGPHSSSLFARACRVIPGGVNSPVRAFRAVGGGPLFLRRGQGARVWDEDGREYLDFVGSWGPLILGHAHPAILEAIERAARDGTSFGAPTSAEVEFAETIVTAVPSIEMVRLVSSGTEATMSAVRLARGYTGRDLLIKFEGCYHGHGDAFLIQAGSGAATFGHPSSPGVTVGTAQDTLNAPYNDLGAVEALFAEHPKKIAAIIVEPVAANMGCVLPEPDSLEVRAHPARGLEGLTTGINVAQPGFLRGLREICDREGALLIFDEVITGFRLAYGGAQERFDVRADLTTLGKIVGGGLPVGAYGGPREIMKHLAPEGPVYQAGTLSGNPLAVAAGRAMLACLRDGAAYRTLELLGERLRAGMERNIRELDAPATWVSIASLGCLYFCPGPVRSWTEAKEADRKRFSVYFREMLRQGIYLAPSQFEAGFLSTAHTAADVDRMVAASRLAMAAALSEEQPS
jgi:glutamate-1-semialdehyde 2,1-aminomutase